MKVRLLPLIAALLASATAWSDELPSSLVSDSTLILNLRTSATNIGTDGADRRNAFVQSMQANYVSGWTPGAVGLGFDFSQFVALKLYARDGIGTMLLLAPSGRGQSQRAWTYPGGYALKARFGTTIIKYGLMQQENPVLEGKDLRALPPAFRGLHATHDAGNGLTFEAGGFNSLKGPGSTDLTSLVTAYGGVKIESLRFLGVNWDYSKDGHVSTYVDKAHNVWKRWYGGITHGVDISRQLRLIGSAAIYAISDHGQHLQGPIDNKAYSYQVGLQKGASQIALSYQRVLGNQFADYIDATNGMYVANGMLLDYIAPHERSAQLKLTVSGADVSLPAWQFAVWYIFGRCETASEPSAAVPGSLAELFYPNGQLLSGSHSEAGVKLSYVLPFARKDAVLTFLAVDHRSSPYYPEPGIRYLRLALNIPWKVF